MKSHFDLSTAASHTSHYNNFKKISNFAVFAKTNLLKNNPFLKLIFLRGNRTFFIQNMTFNQSFTKISLPFCHNILCVAFLISQHLWLYLNFAAPRRCKISKVVNQQTVSRGLLFNNIKVMYTCNLS